MGRGGRYVEVFSLGPAVHFVIGAASPDGFLFRLVFLERAGHENRIRSTPTLLLTRSIDE